MVAPRLPTGRRTLLPVELELIQTLNLSEEEYWYFVDKTESQNGKRPKGYELIPDIQNHQYVIQFAIALVIGYIQQKMAPKPRAPKKPPSLTTADVSNERRYAPREGFSSAQSLAAIGETIPLVFSNTDINSKGGVRVNSKLLWSQMRSLGASQQLRAIFLLASADLGALPDFAGFAIGDSTLKNYVNAKIALYVMANGGRAKENGPERYGSGTLADWPDNDAFSVYWDNSATYKDDVFSGTRTPQTNTQFGAFAPMPNGMKFRVPYELVLKGKDIKDSLKVDIDKKRLKIETSFTRLAGVHSASNGGNKNSIIKYSIYGNDVTNGWGDTFDPWGLEDVKNSVNSGRENIDTNINVGDIYLVGSAIAVCLKKTYANSSQEGLWRVGNTCEVELKVIESGDIYSASDTGTQTKGPSENLTIQRCAVASVANNSSCQVTEIGIKSTVWRQITGFPNANSHPGAIDYAAEVGTVYDYEQENGNIQLGQINKYIHRLSFFRLFARIAGENNSWESIDKGIPFVVKNNNPLPLYHFIRINHQNLFPNQLEFRLVPYPGNLAKRDLENSNVRLIHHHAANNDSVPVLDTITGVTINNKSISVVYPGRLVQLTSNYMSNPEYYLGDAGGVPTAGGTVTEMHNDRSTPWVPDSSMFIIQETKFDNYDDSDWDNVQIIYDNDGEFEGKIKYWWDDENIITRTGLGEAPTRSEFENNTEWAFQAPDGFWYGPGSSRGGGFYEIRRYTKEENLSLVYQQTTETTAISETVASGATGLTLDVKVYNNSPYYTATFQVNNGGQGYEVGNAITVAAPSPTDPNRKFYLGITAVINRSGSLVDNGAWPEKTGDKIGRNLNPYDAVADFVLYDGERSSHLDNPEHELCYVNEQLITSGMQYDKLAVAGLRLNSAKEWSSFSSFSAYIKKGIKVERLIDNEGNTAVNNASGVDSNGKGSSNILPEIVYSLLTDSTIGCGNLIGVEAVDKEEMRTAAKFCHANGFYWDGVITDSQNLREWIFQQASTCFLDFVVKGGKFSLVPNVPYSKSSYMIIRNVTFAIPQNTDFKIKALFTDGNTKDLKCSFLSPEERKPFRANVIYRVEKTNGFAKNKLISLRLNNNQSDNSWQRGSDQDAVETFDLSNWLTSSTHATKFAKYALRTRQLVDHGITFQCAPQSVIGLSPGDYFRLYSEVTHTSRFSNGIVLPDGTIQSQTSISNGDSIYYWNPNDDARNGEVQSGSISISGTKATGPAGIRGSVFTKAQSNASDRIYKIESLSYGEDGLIEVAASFVPLTSEGYLAVLDWTESDFT